MMLSPESVTRARMVGQGVVILFTMLACGVSPADQERQPTSEELTERMYQAETLEEFDKASRELSKLQAEEIHKGTEQYRELLRRWGLE